MKKLLKVAVVLLAICTMFVACVSKPVAGTEGAWKLTCYAGTMNGWNPGEALVDNSFSFTATGSDEFKFTDGSWSLTAVCDPIDALDTEIALSGFGDTGYTNIVFADGVLIPGVDYCVTIEIYGEDEAYVIVSEIE